MICKPIVTRDDGKRYVDFVALTFDFSTRKMTGPRVARGAAVLDLYSFPFFGYRQVQDEQTDNGVYNP